MNPGKVDKKSMRFLLLFILCKWRSSLIDIVRDAKFVQNQENYHPIWVKKISRRTQKNYAILKDPRSFLVSLSINNGESVFGSKKMMPMM